MPGPTKGELIGVADARIEDARALIAAARYDAAYYLAGYAVELALKAHIAKFTIAEEFPDRTRALAAYGHDFERLARAGDVADAIRTLAHRNRQFRSNWDAVLNWRPDVRYECIGASRRQAAETMLDAVSESPWGVATWLKSIC